MVAVSLMPPVDSCASCEGKKAESNARDVAIARQSEAFESHRSDQPNQLSPGALPPISDVEAKAKPVDTVVRPLLSADLVVQASLGVTESRPSDQQENSTLRLQAAQAYGAASGN